MTKIRGKLDRIIFVGRGGGNSFIPDVRFDKVEVEFDIAGAGIVEDRRGRVVLNVVGAENLTRQVALLIDVTDKAISRRRAQERAAEEIESMQKLEQLRQGGS